jgi:hypothetical protein
MNRPAGLADLIRALTPPPESMRAGRNRTWSASDFPQLTQEGIRSLPIPSPSIATTFDACIAQAAQVSEPRAL